MNEENEKKRAERGGEGKGRKKMKETGEEGLQTVFVPSYPRLTKFFVKEQYERKFGRSSNDPRDKYSRRINARIFVSSL